jgi:hypothetical protein
MLSGNPLTVLTVPTPTGPQLQILSSNKSDNIDVSPVAGGLQITNGSWATVATGDFASLVIHASKGNDVITIDPAITLPTSLWGGLGDDTIFGGSGDDHIYGQAGTDQLFGGAGNDTLVNIGDSRYDQATGGDGFDSFWSDGGTTERVIDASADELSAGAVHQVDRFFGFTRLRKGAPRAARPSTDLNGEDLSDPGVDDLSASYQNFAADPLFATDGPSADDVIQGYMGDCWYLSTLAAIARTNPSALYQSVVELGDGTYGVQFADGSSGGKVFVRVDADLPVASWGDLQYAGLGHQKSLWVAVMEKAYACFRYGGLANYADLDGGWMDEAFNDLGYADDPLWHTSSGDQLLDWIANELDAGKAVTFAVNTPPRGTPLIGCHAYTVVSVDTDSTTGARTLVMRNPWGIDGIGYDGNDDGYVRVTPEQALASFWGVVSANVG